MCPRRQDPPKPAAARATPGPQAVGDLLGGVLAAIDLELAAPSAAIGENWAAIVGHEIAAHCRPAGIKAGVLHAHVDSSVWCQQLQLRSPEILRALGQFLGSEAPTDLRFRVGHIGYAQTPEPPRAGAKLSSEKTE